MNVFIENNVCVCVNPFTFNVDLFKRLHKKHKFNVCIILISTEAYMPDTHKVFSNLLEYFYNKDLKIYYVYSSIETLTKGHGELKELFNNNTLYEIPYSMSHLNRINEELGVNNNEYSIEKYKPLPTDCKLFLNLNSRDRSHRYIMMDILERYNLIDDGIISWNSIGNYTSVDTPIGIVNLYDIDYKLKYWYPELKQVDQFWEFAPQTIYKKDAKINIINKVGGPFFYKKVKHQYFIEIVTETEVLFNRITEKTLKPLFFQKPFMVLTAKGFHKELTNFGFELYDEIIDYSFDELPSTDMVGKSELICRNLTNLKEKDYTELHRIIYPKLIRNKKRLIDIYNNKYFFDKELRLLLKNKTPYFYKKYFLENKVDIVI